MQSTDHPSSSSLKTQLLNLVGLTDLPVIKVYNGYGNADNLILYGHVLGLSALPRTRYNQTFLGNVASLLRLFMIKPQTGVRLKTVWDGKPLYTETDQDGFFKFEWKDEAPLEQGWHAMKVQMTDTSDKVHAEGNGFLYIPYSTQYGLISDIDDTFLVSHSSNMRKRLYVLFARNARSRKPFEGVVKHYQLLALGNTTPDAPNPFFYVSSSEWNLYDFLHEFTTVNGLPRGVFLLNVLKRFKDLLKTGQNNHGTKFIRIARIMENYPKQRFVLLGDSSQHDPYIYQSIVKHFPKQVRAVYIRDVYKKNKLKISEVMVAIESAGVPCLFFQKSSEAILHSIKIGLIQETEISEGHIPATEPLDPLVVKPIA